MIPLKDENPTLHPPILTGVLIALNVLVFLWQLDGAGVSQRKILEFACVPRNVTHPGEVVVFEPAVDWTGRGPSWSEVVIPAGAPLPREHLIRPQLPGWATLLSSMFMHGGWMHLLGNMLFLWVFGNNIEDACGRLRFLIFYLLAGLAAALVHVLGDPDSVIPVLGASGAVSGVLGAYILLYPHARVLTLIPFGFVLMSYWIPAVLFLGVWFLIQVTNLFGVAGGGGGVAWSAHAGGFVVGLALIKLFESGEHRGRTAPSERRAGRSFFESDRARRGPRRR